MRSPSPEQLLGRERQVRLTARRGSLAPLLRRAAVLGLFVVALLGHGEAEPGSAVRPVDRPTAGAQATPASPADHGQPGSACMPPSVQEQAPPAGTVGGACRPPGLDGPAVEPPVELSFRD